MILTFPDLEPPENGYETPRFPDGESIFFGNNIHDGGERRRTGFTGGSDETQQVGVGQDPEACSSGQEKPLQEDEKRRQRKLGFRGRVGCYTWTWFTMTMATGGIANVLHSSNTAQTFVSSPALTLPSSIPFRVVEDSRHNHISVQYRSLLDQLRATYIAVQVESWIFQSFVYKFI